MGNRTKRKPQRNGSYIKTLVGVIIHSSHIEPFAHSMALLPIILTVALRLLTVAAPERVMRQILRYILLAAGPFEAGLALLSKSSCLSSLQSLCDVYSHTEA